MKQVFEYGDRWEVTETPTLFKVADWNYDENFSIGIKKSSVKLVLEDSLQEVEEELIAILIATIKFNRRTTLPDSADYKALSETSIANGLRKIFKSNGIYSIDTLIELFSSIKSNEAEEILGSTTPIPSIGKFIS